MKIAIEVEDSGVQAAFGRMLDAGSNPVAYLPAIGEHLVGATQLRFADSRAPDGAPWAPVLRGGAPLRDTGMHLMNAVNYRVDGNVLYVGVPYAWAIVHQEGRTIAAKSAPYLRFKVGDRWASKKEVTIPARPFLGISTEDRAGILDILNQKLLQAA